MLRSKQALVFSGLLNIIILLFCLLGCEKEANKSFSPVNPPQQKKLPSPPLFVSTVAVFNDIAKKIADPGLTEEEIREKFVVFPDQEADFMNAAVVIFGETHNYPEGLLAEGQAIGFLLREEGSLLIEWILKGKSVKGDLYAFLDVINILAAIHMRSKKIAYTVDVVEIFRLKIIEDLKKELAEDDKKKLSLVSKVDLARIIGWDNEIKSSTSLAHEKILKIRNDSLVLSAQEEMDSGKQVLLVAGAFHTPQGEFKSCTKAMRIIDRATLKAAFGINSVDEIEHSLEDYFVAIGKGTKLANQADLSSREKNFKAQGVARDLRDLGCGTTAGIYDFLKSVPSYAVLIPR